MVGLGFSKGMGLMRYILKLWKLLRGTSGEFGRGRIMFALGSLRVGNIMIAVSPAKKSKTVEKCPAEGCVGSLVKRNGKFGAFYGCSNYPNCTYSRSI